MEGLNACAHVDLWGATMHGVLLEEVAAYGGFLYLVYTLNQEIFVNGSIVTCSGTMCLGYIHYCNHVANYPFLLLYNFNQ